MELKCASYEIILKIHEITSSFFIYIYNLHDIFELIKTKKRALCAFDDKRFLLEDGIHSLAFGHHEIPAPLQDVEEDVVQPVL